MFCKWNEDDETCDCYVEGNTEYCASHNAVLRKRDRNQGKEKKIYTLKKSEKKIKYRSSSRAAEERVYNKLVGLWKEGKTCGVEGCDRPCEECHHKKGREGKLLLYVPYWFPACHEHHTYITEHSAWAIEKGYSLPRNQITGENI